MPDILKAAIVVAVFILAATAVAIYYNPYHSCVRADKAQGMTGFTCKGL